MCMCTKVNMYRIHGVVAVVSWFVVALEVAIGAWRL